MFMKTKDDGSFSDIVIFETPGDGLAKHAARNFRLIRSGKGIAFTLTAANDLTAEERQRADHVATPARLLVDPIRITIAK